jgi:Domain of unknown function (DUF4214)
MRRIRIARLKLSALGALMLAACGGSNPDEAIAKAKPASGAALQTYAKNIAETIDLVGSADLVQRFCHNGLGAPCPQDIRARLNEYGLASGGTGVDLAHAFVMLAADRKDANPDLIASDEDYLSMAYRVALGRDPDEGGAGDNLRFIQDTGNRKQMLRSLLQSEEFQRQG